MDIDKILRELAFEIQTIVERTWIEAGLASNSNLVKSIKVNLKPNTIEVYAADYAKYVASGRKRYTKKVPISALITWIKRKKITSTKFKNVNRLAFVIQNAIYKNGIQGKDIITKGEKAIDGSIKVILSELVMKEIKKELDKNFK